MDKYRVNIVIIEPSEIVSEGITNLLLKNENHFYVYKITNLEELVIHSEKEKFNIVIINPTLIINKINDFLKIKRSFGHITWIGLIYSYFENDIISKFDNIINIGDATELISQKINKTAEDHNYQGLSREDLSERETEVLVQLVNGLSNKEISDLLNISIHTVISHRKNIIEKTGIKSLPGLTIYAISKRIIPLDSK